MDLAQVRLLRLTWAEKGLLGQFMGAQDETGRSLAQGCVGRFRLLFPWSRRGSRVRRDRRPGGVLTDLLASGDFCRDTRIGARLHGAESSIREISDRRSLHVTLEDHRLFCHLDRVSPLAGAVPGGPCRYSIPRVAAHLGANAAARLLRLGAASREQRVRRANEQLQARLDARGLSLKRHS